MSHSHLPHIDMKGHYQFITFRTADSTDDFLLSLVAQGKPNREKQMAVDEYLDGSQQGAYLYGEMLRFLFNFIRSKDGDLYELVCFAVMPNHVHLLIKPLQQLSLLMQRLKGASAKGINDILERRGTFWEKDYYDKAIRDENHFRVVYQYIKSNPLKLSGYDAAGGETSVSLNACRQGTAEAVLPNAKIVSGGATQGECCLQQREHPGVSAAQQQQRSGTAKAALPESQRFYGVYDA